MPSVSSVGSARTPVGAPEVPAGARRVPGTPAPRRPGRPGPARWRVRSPAPSGPARLVAVVATLSAVVAVLLARQVFPYLSIDNDEALYRLQAQVLAQGHLFPVAPRPPESFAPWLAVVVDGHYVLKYTPVVPAMYAVSLLVTGGTAAALAVLAAALVVLTYLLGCEVVGDRRVAALAAVLMAASPLVVVQSALLLPYLPFVVLTELAVLALLRGTRRRRPAAVAVAGLAYGLAFAARPFDAVLFLLPFAVWVVRVERGRLAWLARWLAAGAALPLAGLLAFDAAATGHALRLPFALLEPGDALGFGDRKLYPTDPPHPFGPLEGLAGVGEHLRLLVGWAFGGVVLAALSVAAVVRRRVAGPGLALAAGGVLLPVGYVGFWGAWNAAQIWRGITHVGPFYVMPLLVPLALLGARGLADLARARPVAGALAAVAGAAVSAVVLAGALPANAASTRDDRRLVRMVEAQAPRPLVLVAADPPFLMHPTAVVSNPPRLDGRVLYALARGRDDLTVVADHPDRPPYLLRIAGEYHGATGKPAAARLERLAVVRGPRVRLRLVAVPPGPAATVRLVVTAGGRRLSYPLEAARSTTATLVVAPGGASLEGAGTPSVEPAGPPDGAVRLALLAATGDGGPERVLDRQTLPAVPAGDGVDVLAPTRQVGLVGDGPPPALQVLAG